MFSDLQYRGSMKVLVSAPNGKVDIPLVELARHIPNSMSHIQPDQGADLVSLGGEWCDIEVLASVVLHYG